MRLPGGVQRHGDAADPPRPAQIEFLLHRRLQHASKPGSESQLPRFLEDLNTENNTIDATLRLTYHSGGTYLSQLVSRTENLVNNNSIIPIETP